MPIMSKTTRIAVTGISTAGKTVFLTTLLSHLCEFDPEEFCIDGASVEIHGFRELRVKRWPQFRFDAYRGSLARGYWPEKSTDCAQFVCEYDRSDWKYYRKFFSQRLELFDFPGERVTDAAIAEYLYFDHWSDHVLDHFRNRPEYVESAAPYLAYIDQQGLLEDELTQLYRCTLASLILQYKPLISPSTFLLDQHGGVAQHGTVQEIAAQRYSGLSFQEQFAPLSKQAREANPELAKKMRTIYKKYRKQVVLPVFNELGRANRLVVLVDIPSLLAGGVGRFNDNRQILIDLFDALRPDSMLGRALGRVIGFFGRSLDRVAFVAVKADMVHPDDIANGRLDGLLKQMTERARRMLPDVKFAWFACSACCSTRRAETDHRLQGKLAHNNPEKEFIEYDVPQLPEVWPEDWSPADYPFSRVYPDAPENYLKPPRHIGLDKVFKFISEP